jgi:protein TonB
MNTFALSPFGAVWHSALPFRMDRRLLIVTAVVGFHLLGLWALQAGLLRRAVELVIPVQVLSELIDPPQPVVTPAPPAPPPPAPQTPVLQPPPPPRPVARPAPQPVAIAATEPTPQAPAAVTATEPAGVEISTPTDPPAAPAPPAPSAPPRVDLPSSSADYLTNPPPPYPPLSKRLGEQGQVVVRARIEANGTASQAEIHTSSGFDRLDLAALQTVKRWRYVPGKRGGVPEPMWFNIPIRFVLE